MWKPENRFALSAKMVLRMVGMASQNWNTPCDIFDTRKLCNSKFCIIFKKYLHGEREGWKTWASMTSCTGSMRRHENWNPFATRAPASTFLDFKNKNKLLKTKNNTKLWNRIYSSSSRKCWVWWWECSRSGSCSAVCGRSSTRAAPRAEVWKLCWLIKNRNMIYFVWKVQILHPDLVSANGPVGAYFGGGDWLVGPLRAHKVLRSQYPGGGGGGGPNQPKVSGSNTGFGVCMDHTSRIITQISWYLILGNFTSRLVEILWWIGFRWFFRYETSKKQVFPKVLLRFCLVPYKAKP